MVCLSGKMRFKSIFNQESPVTRPVTISSKYQVEIPCEIREQFGLKPGQKVSFVPDSGTLRVVVVRSIQEALGMFKGMNTDNIREEVDEER
jgi:AbrB family looped-hinge helix DNA binding protein